jgi:hypothetical protein
VKRLLLWVALCVPVIRAQHLNNRFFGELRGAGGARLIQLNGRLSW